MSCAGVKLIGPFRGMSCGAIATYGFRGKYYCAAHRTIAAENPQQFTRAKATLGRFLVKRAAEEAQRVAQVDAFQAPESHTGPM